MTGRTSRLAIGAANLPDLIPLVRASCRAGSLTLAAAGLLLLAAACAGSDDGSGAEPDVGEGATTSPTSGPNGAPHQATPAVPSAGCGSSTTDPVVEAERTLAVGDVERRYLLTVPNAHDGDAPLPVVFDFHGLMEGAEIHARMTEYSSSAEEEGFVVVFPHGTGERVQWNVSPDASANDDLTYFDAVVDEIGDTLCVDESRIYATGLSNGAMFTSLMLCERAEVLAAAAPVAGLTDIEGCAPSRAVPIVAFHGTDDPILLFNGGVDVSGIPGFDPQTGGGSTTTRPPADLDGEGYPANVAAFAARNGCDPEPTDTELTAEVIHRVFDCPDEADVEFYIVVGGGHSWPSSEFSRSIGDIIGHTTFDIDATRHGWDFMSRFAND